MAVHVRSVISLRTFLCRPLHINNVKLLSCAYFGERVKRILFSHLLAVHVAQLVQELFLKSVIDRTWIVESTSSIFLSLFLFFKIFFSSFWCAGNFFLEIVQHPPPPPPPPVHKSNSPSVHNRKGECTLSLFACCPIFQFFSRAKPKRKSQKCSEEPLKYRILLPKEVWLSWINTSSEFERAAQNEAMWLAN